MKGFVVSWFFPPNNSSEGLVTFKLLKRSKYQYDVFTQNIHKNWSYNTNEKKLISNNINAIYSKANDYNNWINEGVRYFEANKEKYDFIMTRTTPKESHLIGLKIKKKYPEKIWIASFGDPLYNSPYEQLSSTFFPYSLKNKKNYKKIISLKRIIKNILWYKNNKEIFLNERKAKFIQNLTLKKADIIILNNEYQFKYMLKGYKKSIKSKVKIIPHSFEKDFYKKELKNDKIINISYLGHLDDIRNATLFLKAIKLAKEEIFNIGEKIKVNFYGNLSDNDKLYIMNNNLFDVVNVQKPIDYFTSLKLMASSEWLLLIDADLSSVNKYSVYFPAKLADYIGASTNIIAITMEKGASNDIIEKIGAVKINYDIVKIKNMLIKICMKEMSTIKLKNVDEFDNKIVSSKFDELVLNIVKKKGK